MNTQPAPPLGVVVEDNVEYQGSDSLKIVTPTGTWIYHKPGGGFAALIDRDGNDWIGFRPTGGADGAYRGIPNLVHPAGYFHPGGTDCETRLVDTTALTATIESRADGGAWAVRWVIHPSFARCTVTAAPEPYWFLYEGAPGGRLDEAGDTCLRCDGVRAAASEPWEVTLPKPKWVGFADGPSRRMLCLIGHDGGDEVDSYRPMEGAMTVFGFGRRGLDKHLTRAPGRFTVGFIDDVDASVSTRVIDLSVKLLAMMSEATGA